MSSDRQRGRRRRRAAEPSVPPLNLDTLSEPGPHLGTMFTKFLCVPLIAMCVSLFLCAPPSLRSAPRHEYSWWHNAHSVLRRPRRFPEPPYTLFSSRVLLPDRRIAPAYVFVAEEGSIEAVYPDVVHVPVRFADQTLVVVSPLLVMPGLIDPHVHVNEPGRTHWEGFASASRAAAAGGTTTILDMPLNNIPSTVDLPAYKAKLKAIASSMPTVDVGVIGGIVPGNLNHVQDLLDAGVIALKSFMVDSQSPDFQHMREDDLAAAIGYLSAASEGLPKERWIPYILHAELEGPLDHVTSAADEADATANDKSYLAYVKTRPDSWEVNAVKLALRLANASNVHIHIAHVSSVQVARMLLDIRSNKTLISAKLTAETCTHYLLWSYEDIADGQPLFKCSPPIRGSTNRAQLLGLIAGHGSNNGEGASIDMIASDHSPSLPELKALSDGNVTRAWGGIAGLQYRLQGTWTAAKSNAIGLPRVAELLSEAPARAFGLAGMKGRLEPGLDADIVIWDPEAFGEVSAQNCRHRYKLSPFAGKKLLGKVEYTVLRGRVIFSEQEESNGAVSVFAGSESGKLLVRSSSTGKVRAVDVRDHAVW